MNALPTPPAKRADEVREIVWGGVYVFNATTCQIIGSTVTGPAEYNPGVFSVDVENPGSDGFYVEIRPDTDAAKIVDKDGLVYLDRWYFYVQYQGSVYIGWHTVMDYGNYNGA